MAVVLLDEWMQRVFLDIALSTGFDIPGTAVTHGPNRFLHVSVDVVRLYAVVVRFMRLC